MKAFTLAELIITITIFSILSATAAPIGINYLQSSDAQTTVQQILNDISEQQENSYTKKGKTFSNPVDICFGIKLTNLAIQNTYDFYSGNWDSVNTKCTPVSTTTKKLSNRSTITSSVNEIVFSLGSFRPVSLGTTNINSSTNITSTNSHFLSTLYYNDSIALSSSPTTCALVTNNPISSDNSINTNISLGDGSDNQNIIKCINITVKNNSYSYILYLTDEGLLYYNKIS